MAKYSTQWHFEVCKHVPFNHFPREMVLIIPIARTVEMPCRSLNCVSICVICQWEACLLQQVATRLSDENSTMSHAQQLS